MILLNQERFEMMPAGIFYIEVPANMDASTAMITLPITVKGNTLRSGGDVWEGGLSFAATEQDDGKDQWPCIGNVYDEGKGYSESMDLTLILTRGGLIGEEGLTFIVFEAKDLETMKGWMDKAITTLSTWMAKQSHKFPEVMRATDETYNNEDFN